MTMRDRRANYELRIGFGLEFNRGVRRIERYQLALADFVRNQNGTFPQRGPEDSVFGRWLVTPALSSLLNCLT